MSANFDSDGNARRLDRKPEPDENVTEQSVSEPRQMVRFLLRIFRRLSAVERRWAPSRIDFPAQSFDATGTTLYRFPHPYAGKVRFWLVEWTGAAAPNLRLDASTTEDLLVLTSTSAGTGIVRVEQAG